MADPVVSPVRGCGPDAGSRGPSAGKLRFRARPKPPRSDVLDQATLALVPLNLDGWPTPQDPVQRLLSINVKPGVEKQLATLDPPPDSILAGRISLHPDGNRLAVSFVRQHGKIYMLEGF